MSLGAFVLKKYVQWLRPKRELRTQSREDYYLWQFGSSSSLFELIPNLNLNGQRVLEIGCGTGGRSAWLAKSGPSEVAAIDINREEIAIARELTARLFPEIQNLRFLESQQNTVIADLGTFDVVLLIDSLEHVQSPCNALKLAYQYVRPGGTVYFTTIGWYHHSGSHTGYPFANLFFSDETILNVIRWQLSEPAYVPSIWDSDCPIARWAGIYDLRDRPGEWLNKITIREMKKLLNYSEFRQAKLHVLGFRNPRLKFLNPLSRVPLFQEAIHSYVIGELIR